MCWTEAFGFHLVHIVGNGGELGRPLVIVLSTYTLIIVPNLGHCWIGTFFFGGRGGGGKGEERACALHCRLSFPLSGQPIVGGFFLHV